MGERTDWESASSWYDKAVGKQGHYYHQQVILPHMQRLLKQGPSEERHLLDLACGQGILARHLPQGSAWKGYLGIDGSKTLIAQAKSYNKNSTHQFIVGDLSIPLALPRNDFSHAAIILALQNIANPAAIFNIAAAGLRKEGVFIIVMNHPCFRIPRQSSWGVDSAKKAQYRRIDRYMSPLKIPIQTRPGQAPHDEPTLSFHHPLSFFVTAACQAGFAITGMEEWCSDKTSTGKAAAMENRARQEFPLFLTLICRKL